AHGPDLGPPRRRRHGHRHSARPASAREDRARTLPPRASADRLGRGLPVPAVIRAVILAVASVLAGGAASAAALHRIRAIRGQLLLLGAGAALLSAAAVVIAGLVM